VPVVNKHYRDTKVSITNGQSREIDKVSITNGQSRERRRQTKQKHNSMIYYYTRPCVCRKQNIIGINLSYSFVNKVINHLLPVHFRYGLITNWHMFIYLWFDKRLRDDILFQTHYYDKSDMFTNKMITDHVP